jgi:hypothetical protein
VRLSAAGEGGSKVITQKPQALFPTFSKKSQKTYKIKQYQYLTQNHTTKTHLKTNPKHPKHNLSTKQHTDSQQDSPKIRTISQNKQRNGRKQRRYRGGITAVSQRWNKRPGRANERAKPQSATEGRHARQMCKCGTAWRVRV